jgi:MerR family mercuric resistance operon transcriptional regulator
MVSRPLTGERREARQGRRGKQNHPPTRLDLGPCSEVYAWDVLTVSKLAEAVGVGPDTIRYYEREGLIPQADRTPTGYRVYDQEAVRRVRFIRGSQRFGLRLREIKGLLEVMDKGLCPCGHASELISGRMAEIDQQIAELKTLKTDLARLSGDVGPDKCAPGVWPCEREFVQAGGGDGDGR